MNREEVKQAFQSASTIVTFLILVIVLLAIPIIASSLLNAFTVVRPGLIQAGYPLEVINGTPAFLEDSASVLGAQENEGASFHPLNLLIDLLLIYTGSASLNLGFKRWRN